MKMKITGDLRTVANSAWISTLNEIKAMDRSDDDARRVVKFLVDNHHTSPFESVTISMFFDLNKVKDKAFDEINLYLNDLFCRFGEVDGLMVFSIDLLNFIKVTYHKELFDGLPWKLFAKEESELAEICSSFKSLGGKVLTKNVDPVLGQHTMTVDLVSYHDVGIQDLNRATWRVSCPLSIAVQILRHRAGSYNMSSGRYRTLRQDMLMPGQDCINIFNKAEINMDSYLKFAEASMQEYSITMAKAKKAKDDGRISNEEYKRLREFARFILPEGRMTELYITYYLNDFYDNYLPLRDSEHAQMEHIWIAQEMRRVLENAKK
jgi:flavin-dependent thymidylate synthase